MKFSIEREILLQNLNHVSKALSTKPQMPILTGIQIDVQDDYLKLTASNSEISIQTKIDKNKDLIIEETGSVVLPGRYLLEIVRKVDAKIIDFVSFEENMVKILADRSNFTLNVLDKSTFPYLVFEESEININLDVLNLKQIIKKTAFAASTSESRMVLTGVNFTTEKNKLEVIATDSYRLAKKFILFNNEYPTINVVISSKSLDELNKIIDDPNETVNIYFTNVKVLFKYKNILFQTRLIEGIYPNTASLIPTDFLTSLKFNKNELLAAIDRASLFTNSEMSNIIKLTLNSDKIVEITSTTNEIGAVLEELNPLYISNLIPFQIAFSSRYFLEAIKVFDSNEIIIHFTGEIKPFIITGEYDVNHIQLILPVRVA